MHARTRLLVAAALTSVLLAVWGTFSVLVGVPHTTGVTTTHTAPVGPMMPVRAETSRTGSPHQETDSEVRRLVRTGVEEAVAVDTGARLLLAPPAPAGPVAFDFPRPSVGDASVGPRQERAPPGSPYSPRHTRAPPSTPSS
ncbi:hypothetical protein [Streptomyces sp. NBC_00690]|uniref:hypothetical protein n=1 Tax=Streptomyces sp. NBC_00690 TaxID=2975808 RepID=UPI002E2D8932|nr:hypothetical protein [Streptomyces sp. NBC_00690]